MLHRRANLVVIDRRVNVRDSERGILTLAKGSWAHRIGRSLKTRQWLDTAMQVWTYESVRIVIRLCSGPLSHTLGCIFIALGG
jgi:hypothetical protein